MIYTIKVFDGSEAAHYLPAVKSLAEAEAALLAAKGVTHVGINGYPDALEEASGIISYLGHMVVYQYDIKCWIVMAQTTWHMNRFQTKEDALNFVCNRLNVPVKLRDYAPAE